jgi:glycosyltransferase involved in cell wall biosynthesis
MTRSSASGIDPAARKLSVSIITKNESLRIERCLRSVAFADQIVVLDSGSSDDTVDVARRLGAEVRVDPDWPGFGRQKNRALALCRHPWVLSIDADEVVSEELARAIREVVRSEVAMPENGWWIRRRSRFCGQTMRFGLWGKDQVLRLFRRDQGSFTDDIVHEHVICAKPVGRLPGILHHDSVDSIEDAKEKTFRYARAGAVKLRARGKGGRFSAWGHATWSFLRGYVLRLGFLDGRNGLILAWLTAQGTYWRYRWAAMDNDLGDG